MTTPEHLANILTNLAKYITDGVIVELGSYHGKGSIALAKEAQVEVFSIDDFQKKRGWIGERYGPEDEEIYWANLREAGVADKVTQIKLPFRDVAEQWQLDIGLLYWDPGMMDRFHLDFLDWAYYIIPNGIFIAKDTAQGHLGTFPVIEVATVSGKWENFDYWNGVSFLRRLE